MAHLHFDTDHGRGFIEYGKKGIISVELPTQSALKNDLPSGENTEGQENAAKAAELLISYFKGKPVDFSPLMLDLHSHSDFFLKVCSIVRNIPQGKVLTYGDIAKMAGSPRSCRAVGRVMATNPIPLIIPCHRVVASNGLLTGYSAEGGLETKAALLKMEGVHFRKKGVVHINYKKF